MIKKKVSVYIAGGFIVALAIILLVFVSMIIAEYIHPRQIPLTITTPSAERDYDGTPLTAEEYTLKYGKLVEGHILDVVYGAGQTRVGHCENAVTVHVMAEDGSDVTDLYKIDVIPGTLRVNPKVLHVTSSTVTKYYDGNVLRGRGYEITQGEVPEGHTVDAGFYRSQQFVGEVENTMQIVILNGDHLDVSDQFEISYTFGTLAVYPRPLTISTKSAEKVYDGLPLRDATYSIEDGTIPDGQTMKIEVVGEQSAVGESENSVTLSMLDAEGNDVTGQYHIKYKLGTLKITPVKLVIQTADASRTYNGRPLEGKEYEITNGELVEGHVLKPVFYQSQLYVGECENTMKALIVDQSNQDVSDQYEITYTFGQLKVYKRRLTIVSGSAEKIFDGIPLTSDHCEVQEGTVVSGETLHCESIGTRTLAGQSVNYINAYVVDKDGNDMSNQYEIIYRAGTLTVTPRKISIKSSDATKPYDGTPLSSSGWERLAGELCEGHEMNVKTFGQQISVGECDNQIVYVEIFDTASGQKVDVTGSYQIECYYGTLSVTMP